MTRRLERTEKGNEVSGTVDMYQRRGWHSPLRGRQSWTPATLVIDRTTFCQ